MFFLFYSLFYLFRSRHALKIIISCFGRFISVVSFWSFLVVVSGFSTCLETQREMKPNVPQQGKPPVTATTTVRLISASRGLFSLIAGLWEILFCCFVSSSIRFDLANLGSVTIFWPLLNGGALRYISMEWRNPIEGRFTVIFAFAFSLRHKIYVGFHQAGLFSSLQAGFEFLFY